LTGPEAARRLLASPVLRRIAALADEGEVFLVGGSVRDRLLGLPCHDHDLVTTGDPAVLARALTRAFHGRSFLLGHPPKAVWRVVAGPHAFDLWGVESTLERDIRRRDFTVNALVWRLPRGPLIDLVQGLDDLAAGRLCVVAAENLRDDPLRVLRGLRLVATRPQLALTTASERQLGEAAAGLPRVARERVTDELRLLLAGPAVRRALAGAQRTGALAALAPGWASVKDTEAVLAQAQALQRLRAGAGSTLGAGASSVAAALLAAPAAGFPARWDEAAAAEELERIGFPRRAARRLAAAASHGEQLARAGLAPGGESRVTLLDAAEPAAAAAWAVARLGPAALPAARALLCWRRRFVARAPLVGGEELVEALGLPAGPARARAIRELAVARARGEVRSRRQALAFLRSSLC
jgi:tRNA nucleotidyltransferase/poly(A) polymerase